MTKTTYSPAEAKASLALWAETARVSRALANVSTGLVAEAAVWEADWAEGQVSAWQDIVREQRAE
jgi:hypothetical protein